MQCVVGAMRDAELALLHRGVIDEGERGEGDQPAPTRVVPPNRPPGLNDHPDEQGEQGRRAPEPRQRPRRF